MKGGRNSRVRFLLAPHLADDVGERHDVVFGQRERLYLGQLPLHLDVGDHLPQLLATHEGVRVGFRRGGGGGGVCRPPPKAYLPRRRR